MLAGIETGGTKVACGVSDPADPTELLMTRRFPTTSPGETISRIVEFIRDADDALGLDAVGIASFGPVNVDPDRERYGWITGTSKPGWANTKLLERVSQQVAKPLALLSDVSGAALGEQQWGAGRDVTSVAYATFGTGVGIGVVIRGHVLHSNGAPEVGHLLVRRHPFDDFAGCCPFHGDCLEGLAAGPAVQARWGTDSSHLPSRIRGEAFEILGFYMAQAIAAIAYSTGVERVVVGGGVLNAPGLLDEARRQLAAVTGGPLAGHPISSDPWDFVVPPALGERSGVLGAIAAARMLSAAPTALA
ncbi:MULTISPECIES: ROK family protein [unclassified Rathayibacter]|uniref:ROK family protein n=1 Tax=unclassified Rathayibacter TaxID=2609250 RepID=UPI000F4CFD4A|nr:MULTISPECIES: ROK family protein [unclassified Rathayibacter]ROP49149.1 fructokinase [Rathayibacter sp. PhB186]ROS50734.1 fructokinase [Rathayibacter sp. PhB185]